MLQIIALTAILGLLTRPVGWYLTRVAAVTLLPTGARC
jgi:hypothetical protein